MDRKDIPCIMHGSGSMGICWYEGTFAGAGIVPLVSKSTQAIGGVRKMGFERV